MDNASDRFRKSNKTDIRAPGKLNLFQALGWEWQFTLTLLLSDALALALAWRLAAYLNRFYSALPSELNWGVWLGLPGLFWLFAGLTLFLFANGGLYRSSTQWKNYVRAVQLISLVYLLSLVVSYFYDPKLDAPRSLFFSAWFGSIALVVGCRMIATLLLRQFQILQQQVPIFLIAPSDRLGALARILKSRSNYRIVGAALASTANSPHILQSIRTSGAREVLAEQLPSTVLASTLYWQLRKFGITLRLIPSSLETLHRRGVLEVCAGMPTLRVEASFPLLNGLDYRLKRWLDFLAALLGVLVISPLLLGLAIAIKVSSPGPVFFCQERVGLHGKVFQMWKFRTMVQGAAALQTALENQNQSKDGVLFKIKDDPRITAVGRFLRRTSLDELPQLFNVLLGQMSLVGPRPLPVRDVERFASWHHIRHQVLPGMTGLWQVSGRSDIDDFSDAVRLDLYYIDNWSLNLDVEILIETLRIVLFGKGAY